jgi:hypothetical protein
MSRLLDELRLTSENADPAIAEWSDAVDGMRDAAKRGEWQSVQYFSDRELKAEVIAIAEEAGLRVVQPQDSVAIYLWRRYLSVAS